MGSQLKVKAGTAVQRKILGIGGCSGLSGGLLEQPESRNKAEP